MPFDEVPVSETAAIDQQIESLISRIAEGDSSQETLDRVHDLTSRRVELTEPAGFARIERMLGMEIAS